MKIHIRGTVLDLSSPKIMGILNATPDSFSDGGRYNTTDVALKRIEQMIGEGADIIDIGGESTRPGSEPVSKQQEADRVMPILEQTVANHPDTLFSIDTTCYSVAQQALELGVHFINDVSGLQREPDMAQLADQYDTGYILMHSLWPPKTMQENPAYDNVIDEINGFFKQQLQQFNEKTRKNVILDPGIGFGKTIQHNCAILNQIEAFRELDHPVLIGASRKSSIGTILNDRSVDDRLTGTVVAHYHALLNGASILRVHDVKEAHDSVLMFNRLAQG